MSVVKWINRVLLWIGGVALLAMVAQICVAAFSRALFDKPIYGTLEISSYYYMVAVSLLPLGAVQAAKGHVIVEVFTQFLRAGVRKKIDLFAALLTIVYTGVLGWGCLESALTATQLQEYLHLYAYDLSIWPARWILVIGIIGFLITIAAQVLTGNHAASDVDIADGKQE